MDNCLGFLGVLFQGTPISRLIYSLARTCRDMEELLRLVRDGHGRRAGCPIAVLYGGERFLLSFESSLFELSPRGDFPRDAILHLHFRVESTSREGVERALMGKITLRAQDLYLLIGSQ